LLVQGEVSNFKIHGPSGHAYFTLKDSLACIDCIMYRDNVVGLRFTPTQGLQLMAAGRLDVYPLKGAYQLYVHTLEPVGVGALELAFQQTKARLEAEGLFAPKRK